MTQSVGIIDYGVGNLRSVVAAFQAVGATTELVTDPGKMSSYNALILPGVGSFRAAKEQLDARGFQDPLVEAARSDHVWLMGICVGMQMLASIGEENGETPGLGLIPGKVQRFMPSALATHGLKIPHVGFDEVRLTRPSPLFEDLGQSADFYFTHSYRMICEEPADLVAYCQHGETFATVIQRGKVIGAQFHPEKSQSNGLKFLKNFLTSAQCQRND